MAAQHPDPEQQPQEQTEASQPGLQFTWWDIFNIGDLREYVKMYPWAEARFESLVMGRFAGQVQNTKNEADKRKAREEEALLEQAKHLREDSQ